MMPGAPVKIYEFGVYLTYFFFRYFAAKSEFEILTAYLKLGPQDGCESLYSNIQDTVNSPQVLQMLDRCRDCDVAMREYNMEAHHSDERWTLGLDMFGYRTHYIVEDDGIVLVRVEGSQENLPLFEQLSIIRELQLYKDWVPFCNKSDLIHEVSETDMISFINIWSPLGNIAVLL